MSKTYIYDTGTVITLDCGCDVSASSVTTINVQKPDATSTTWAAGLSTASTEYITYTVSSADLVTAGRYMLQAYIETASWKGRGETAELWVYDVYK